MLLTLRCRRAPNEKAVICLLSCLYQVLSHILGVSLPPSACSNPLCRHPPPSSEGGEGAPAPCAEINCFGKEDSNERNPSGVSFVFVQVAFALQRRGEGAPALCSKFFSVLKPCSSLMLKRLWAVYAPPCVKLYAPHSTLLNTAH